MIQHIQNICLYCIKQQVILKNKFVRSTSLGVKTSIQIQGLHINAVSQTNVFSFFSCILLFNSIVHSQHTYFANIFSRVVYQDTLLLEETDLPEAEIVHLTLNFQNLFSASVGLCILHRNIYILLHLTTFLF